MVYIGSVAFFFFALASTMLGFGHLMNYINIPIKEIQDFIKQIQDHSSVFGWVLAVIWLFLFWIWLILVIQIWKGSDVMRQLNECHLNIG